MRFFDRLRHDRSGAIATMVAVTSVALMGFTGLGTEVVMWYSTQQQMQAVADAAAASAIVAEHAGDSGRMVAEARGVAAQNGFVNGSNGVQVVVNTPPRNGSHTADTSAVEVIITAPPKLLFARQFLPASVQQSFAIAARSVATVVNPSVACIIALDPHASGAIRVNNNAQVTDPVCGVAANSDSSTAMTVSNNAVIDGPVSVHGEWSLGTNAQLKGSPDIEKAPPVVDPYANVQRQPMPACTTQTATGGNNQTLNLQPGRFCSGLTLQNNATVNFAPGVYYIDQQLDIGNNATLDASGGVTVVINGNFPMSIGNNATINITAQATGPYAGIAIFGDRNGTASVTQTFSNNTDLNIKGAIYFPNQTIVFNNNAQSVPGHGCTQIIGRIVQLANNVNVENHCDGVGTTPVDIGGSVALVE